MTLPEVLPLLKPASGSVGDTTASHNQYGSYTRARTDPNVPLTAWTNAVRAQVTASSQYWSNSLSEAQRIAWDCYARYKPVVDRLGDVRYITGQNHYIRVNVLKRLGITARRNAPPDTLDDPQYTHLRVVQITNGRYFAYIDNTDDWATTKGGVLLIRLSPVVSAGVNFYKGPYRLAAHVLGRDFLPPTTTQSVNSPFTGDYYAPHFWAARAVTSDGRVSRLDYGKVELQ